MNFDNLKYSVVRVKAISFFVNDHFKINDPLKQASLEMGQLLGINADENTIEIRLRAYFFYPENRENILAEIVVQNVFKVENLKQYTDGKTIKLPPKFIVNLLQLCISHSRALMCDNLYGSSFQDYVLPITNAEHVAQHFYPAMFDIDGKIKEETEFLLTEPQLMF